VGKLNFMPMLLSTCLIGSVANKASGGNLPVSNGSLVCAKQIRSITQNGKPKAAHGAAARFGMKRTTLQSRMQKLGITREEYAT
jgi:transcriptional regulator with GAF, ATPase, and Fis domain